MTLRRHVRGERARAARLAIAGPLSYDYLEHLEHVLGCSNVAIMISLSSADKMYIRVILHGSVAIVDVTPLVWCEREGGGLMMGG